MYERFTDRARKVMQLANQEAQRLNHEYVGTEHILLGLVKEGSGVAANVLKNLEVDLRTIRLEVEKLVQSGPDMVIMGKLPQTPGAKKAIVYSMEEARNLNHNYIGTEHILLGLLREQEGVAAQVLMNLGLKLEDVCEEVLNLLGHGVEGGERSPAGGGGGQIGQRTPVVTGIARDYFTERTLKVMQFAKQAAQRSNRGYLDTGHVLLGIIEEGHGVAAIVLKNLGFDLQTTLAEVEKLWPSATEPVKADKLILTPETKKAIEFARDEASKFNHRYIGTESLLLGLLVEQEGTAARALVKLGRTLEEVREAVFSALGRSSAPAKLTDEEVAKIATYLADKAAQGDKEYPALPGSMYDRFTDRARGVVQLAIQQAKQFNHEYIGTEHILLGLVGEGSGVAANVLKNLNIDLDKIRSEVGKLVQGSPDRVASNMLPWTPRAKKVAEYAMEEARNLNHNYIGTEHLLLGLLREEEGVAAQVLMNFGLKLEEVRKEVLTLLGHGIEGGEAE